MCGFLGPPVYVTSLPEAVRIVESGSTRQPQLILLSGGWGDAGIISDGRLQLLSGRSAVCSLQSAFVQVLYLGHDEQRLMQLSFGSRYPQACQRDQRPQLP